MKAALFFFTLLISTLSLTAQDSTKVKAETPKIVAKLQFGKLAHFNDVDIKLVEVVNDSRCPKGVSCVWAGEATVLVDVFKDGKKIDQKKIVFNAANQFGNKLPSIFSSDVLNISGYGLHPYPVYGEKIKDKDYYINIDVKNLQ